MWLLLFLFVIAGVTSMQGEAPDSNLSPAENCWTVDGVWLGALPDQIHHRLKPDEFLKGWMSWEGQEIMAYGRETVFVYPGKGVVRCQGHKLRLGTKLVLQTGDPVRRAETVLGNDYRTHGAMGWCHQDPCLWHSYKRAGCVIDLLVSNDNFIRSNLPQQAWPVSLSKVWAVELRRPKLGELIEQTQLR